MKISNRFITALSAFLLFSACSKNNSSGSNNTSTDLTKATANAQYDQSNYGLYKGVFVGSTGIVIISVNNDNTLSALLKIDGTNYTFTSTQTFQPNVATSINFVSGSNSFTFSISANGSNPTVTNLIFNGHPNAAITVLKQTSTVTVDCYEGTYTTLYDHGTFNTAVASGKLTGVALSGVTQTTEGVTGTISNNVFNGSVPSTQTTLTGIISGNTISGTITNSSDHGTFQGVKTL